MTFSKTVSKISKLIISFWYKGNSEFIFSDRIEKKDFGKIPRLHQFFDEFKENFEIKEIKLLFELLFEIFKEIDKKFQVLKSNFKNIYIKKQNWKRLISNITIRI